MDLLSKIQDIANSRRLLMIGESPTDSDFIRIRVSDLNSGRRVEIEMKKTDLEHGGESWLTYNIDKADRTLNLK